MNIDALHRLLALADLPKDPYTVAEVAGSLLAANGNDSTAMAHYARALGELKLFAAAQKFLRSPASAHSSAGLLPWTSRTRRFSANLRALGVKDPLGAGLVQAAAADLPRYELHQCADNNFQILDTQGPVHAAWLGTLANHQAARSLWQFDRVKTPVPAPIVFEGLGFGWLFLQVLETTQRTFVDYSCAVHILEGDPLALAMLLHMHDLQGPIREARTHWFVRSSPEAALTDFRRALAGNPTLTIPGQFVRCTLRPRRALCLDDTLRSLGEKRRQQRDLLMSQTADHYQGKDPSHWAARFDDALSGGGKKLRILGITSRYTTVLQHSMAEMHAAIQSQFRDTCEMQIAIEPNDQSLENPFLEMVACFKPDLIFQLSRLRYENPFIPRDVPFLCWDQDNLPCMRTAEATASLGPLTYVAGHGAVLGFTSLHWPRENCIFAHPAGATVRYHDRPVAPELLAQHACDFSYVSNASASAESIAEQIRVRWKQHPAWLNIFDRVAQTVLAQSEAGGSWEYGALKNLVRKTAYQLAVPLEENPWREMSMELHTYADRCFRHTTLNWVARWSSANHKTLRLYGRGWEKHATLAPFAAGIAQPGEEARAIYQASKINLQLIEPGFIHSRALDGLAAGGFFLTRSTQSDGLDSPAVKTLYALARYTVENHIQSDADLEAVTDPHIQSMIAASKAYYLSHEVKEPMWRSLQVWADVPPAGLLFPRFKAITFTDEPSFAALASRYLSDQGARTQLAAAMRQVVEEKFSYRARWNTFLHGVQSGLAAATTLAAGV